MNRRNNTNLYISVLLIVALLFSLLTIYASSEVASALGVSAKSAVLYEPETRSFLFEKAADVRRPMASTTKIMTALVAIESCELSEVVEVDDSAIGTEGSSAYLKKGDVLTMEELLYALLLQSANDAAVAIACHIGGSVEAFADMMNERAADLGLTDTHFTNPHGLDDEEHYTTARELAIIAAAAMECETVRTITSTYKKSFVTEERSRTYVNHNKLLRLYPDAIGVKTGFTKKSGRCLVGAAEREGLSFITVTLDAPSDWQDHELMLDYGYERLEKISLASLGDYTYDIPLLDGTGDSVKVSNLDGLSIIVERGEHSIEEFIKLSRLVVAPVREGDILGEVIFTIDGERVGSLKLVATEDAPKKEEKNGIFKKIYRYFFG